MIWIYLGNEEYARVSKKDAFRVNRYSWTLKQTGYVAAISSPIKDMPLHIFLLGIEREAKRKEFPNEVWEVDHINRNKLDNRRSNLRVITRTENLRNKGGKYVQILPTEIQKTRAKAQKLRLRRKVKSELMVKHPELLQAIIARTIVKIVNTTLNIVYPSITEAAKVTGCHTAGITNYLLRVKKGEKVEHCGGYQWERYDEDKHGWMLLL